MSARRAASRSASRAYTRPERQPTRIARMIAQTASMVFVSTETEVEALLLEANFIKQMKPRYNVLLRDDKSFPYILITGDHEAPQLAKHRGARTGKGDYFGPFANVGAVHRTLNALQRAFLLRTCSDSYYENRTRPCLLYQIKRCSAPCTGEISLEDYAGLVGETRDFLSGRSRSIRHRLAREMEEAAETLAFEKAARLRDRIAALSAIQGEQSINPKSIPEADVFAIAEEAGQFCIEVFFFRTYQNWGNRAYFPRADRSLGPAEVLDAFLAQFYLERPAPRLVLLSHNIESHDALCGALERARRPSHRDRRADPRREEGTGRERVAQCARSFVAQTRRRGDAGETARRARRGFRRRSSDPPRRGLRQFPYHGDQCDRRDDRRGRRRLREEPISHLQHQEHGADARRRLRDDARSAGAALRRASRGRARASRRRRPAPFPKSPISCWSTAGAGNSRRRARFSPNSASKACASPRSPKAPTAMPGRETFFVEGRDPFKLPPRDPALYFVQRLRDEAHRFAIGTHRAKRKKEFVKSPLDEIPGVGPARKRALLNAFGTAKAVAGAGLADLEKAPGVNAATAKLVYDFFHEKG